MRKILTLIILIIFSAFIFSGCTSHSDYTESYNEDYNSNISSTDEAIQENWDSIKEYLSGTETIEACCDSGCYSLDADISNGEISQIYFPNEGYLYFSADIEESGDASDTDDEGRNWDFTLDMGSSIVEDAVQEWANNNDYEIN